MHVLCSLKSFRMGSVYLSKVVVGARARERDLRLNLKMVTYQALQTFLYLEDIDDHRSYIHNLSSCEIKALKKFQAC